MDYLNTARDRLKELRGRTDSPDSGPTPEQVAAMSLDEFAQAGLIVTVRSGGLGCRVLFVSDNVPEKDLQGQDLLVYRAHELRKLATLRPQLSTLRTLNEVKRVFGTEAVVTKGTRSD